MSEFNYLWVKYETLCFSALKCKIPAEPAGFWQAAMRKQKESCLLPLETPCSGTNFPFSSRPGQQKHSSDLSSTVTHFSAFTHVSAVWSPEVNFPPDCVFWLTSQLVLFRGAAGWKPSEVSESAVISNWFAFPTSIFSLFV